MRLKKVTIWYQFLTPSLFIEVPELSQEGSFICVLGISNLHISTILLLNVGIVPTVWYIFFSFYYRLCARQSVNCFTMEQTGFERMESFIFLYIWNQKCSIQYSVLHNYYTAWISLVKFFFLPSLAKNAGTFPTVWYIFFHFYYRLWKKTSWVAIVKNKYGCDRLP
jgi:hypothetical protein